MIPRAAVVALACAVACSLARGEVALHGLFGDHMVLQRDREIAVFGFAEPGERVSVRLATREAHAIAGDDRRFVARLDALPAGGPHELVAAGSNQVRVRDVWIGDVWLCAGQSNMEWPLASCDGGPDDARAIERHRLRFFQVRAADSTTRAIDVGGRWSLATPQSVLGLSGVAFYFARDLAAALDAPIGVIQCTSAGTPAEPWTDRAAMEADPELASALRRFARKSKARPGALFNGMVAPLAPFEFRGVLWYQGESNVAYATTYRRLFPTLIASWRALFDDADLPFVFVELAGFGEKPRAPQESAWAELREAQALALALPSTAIALAHDVGSLDPHPTDKRTVGARCALAARALVHGHDVVANGPTMRTFEVVGSSVRVRFDHARGLRATDRRVAGFTIAGADRRFVVADARIEGEAIVVRSDDVADPVAVRYAWADNPDGNVRNGAGLPARPFRTDDWARARDDERPARSR